MKILDSSVVIAVLGEINSPDLIDDIIKLGHELVIPYGVYLEVMAGPSAEACRRLVLEKKIAVAGGAEGLGVSGAGRDRRKLRGRGEADVLLTYERLAGDGPAYCILDDRGARAAARRRGIPFMGLVGLLRLMRERGILSSGKFGSVMSALKRSSFRMPI